MSSVHHTYLFHQHLMQWSIAHKGWCSYYTQLAVHVYFLYSVAEESILLLYVCRVY